MKIRATARAGVAAQLGQAVHQKAPTSMTGLLERAFARLFEGLVYVQIWEDPVADMQALQIAAGERVVCIASGGCNALSYLTRDPAEVTAVDLSPAHAALVDLKRTAAQRLPDHAAFYQMLGEANQADNLALYDRYIEPALAPESRAWWEGRSLGRRRVEIFARGAYRYGVLGRFLVAVGLLARLGRVDFDRFLASPDLAAQRAFYEAEIAPLMNNRLIGMLARRRLALFGLGIPPAQHEKLAADGGGDILPVLRERVRKLFCDYPVGANYFVWQATRQRYRAAEAGAVPPYLDPANFQAIQDRAARLQIHNRSVTEVLSARSAGSVDCAVLLDAQDWMNDAQLTALWSELTRTAAPGARVLFRTGGASDILPGRVAPSILRRWRRDEAASSRALREDRSAIYGGVHLYRFEG